MIRSFQSVAGIVVLLVAPAIAVAQQTGTRQGPPASPTSSTIEGSYTAGAAVPSRRVQTRTSSNGREVITETTETPRYGRQNEDVSGNDDGNRSYRR